MSRFPLSQVSSKYGAPMGRHCAADLGSEPRSLRLFQLVLDSGGYDAGGAYWGFPNDLYCAMDREGNIQTVRASSRLHAAMKLDLDPRALRVRLQVPAWWRELPAVVEYLYRHAPLDIREGALSECTLTLGVKS